MAALKVRINPQMLSWARKTAGISIEDAARKIGGTSFAPERLAAWESGVDQPTSNYLRKASEVYKRPLGTFFLSDFPRDFTIPRDFRRLPGDGERTLSPALRLQLRHSEERREIALDLYADLGEKPPAFTLSATLDDDPEELGARIRESLGVTYPEQLQWRDRARYKPLKQWRHRFEEAGVLVFQFSGVEKREALGFSRAESVLPVIAVNRKMKPNGRIFTMMHEFVHLMLRISGICDIEEDFARPPEEQRIEVFCNKVAAAALVPASFLLSEALISHHGSGRREWLDREIEILADKYSVSREVILRRLLTNQRTTEEFYKRKREEYHAQLNAAESNDEEGGFESPANKAVSLNGPAFTRLVLENYHTGRITLSNVSNYLGVRLKHLAKIEQSVLIS